jgi:hypothetical protein
MVGRPVGKEALSREAQGRHQVPEVEEEHPLLELQAPEQEAVFLDDPVQVQDDV